MRLPVASRRTRLVARPARRRARQSRPRVRAQPPQRRLDGASTSSARRHGGSLEGQVLGPARRGAARRAPRRAAEAGDVHERVRPLGRGGGALLQARAGRDPRRARRGRPRASAACRRARAAGSPATTACARSRSTLKTPEFMRLRIGVGRPGRGDPRPLADYVLSNFEPRGRRRDARRPCRRRRRDARRRRPRAGAGAVQLGRRSRGYDSKRAEPAGSAFRSWTVRRSCIRSSGELRESDRLRAFAEAFPARCARLGAGAAAAARGAARGARPAARRARCPRTPTRATPPRPSPGSSARSASRCCRAAACTGAPGLEPAPHLVGERARALDVLAAGGLVCASAAALAEPMPPAGARPEPIRIAPGEELEPRAARRVACARRLRARRARRRARAVRRARRARRRLPDDGPRAAAHRVLGRRDRADPRLLAVHAARAASGRGARRSTRPPSAASTSSRRRSPTRTSRFRSRTTSCRRSPAGPDLVWRAGRGAARSGRRKGSSRSRSRARPSSTRFPPGSRSRSRRSGRRSSRAGSPRPRTS